MTDWTRESIIFTNDDDVYENYLNKVGANLIEHRSLILFGDPRQETFLNEISYSTHVFAYGDSLSKIAFKEYGNPKFWWVIAWFNTKPTDFHCEVGDIIRIPHPINEVMAQVFSRAT